MEGIEIWKDISGYEGLYQVSNLGRIKGLKNNIILKNCNDSDGYHIVSLYKNGKGLTQKVHRLVGIEFLENINNYPVINHKDENKTNNNVENLEWCTVKYNTNYGTGIERQSCQKMVKVNKYDLNWKFICEYKSIASTKKDGFTSQTVSDCCRGKHKSHKGFRWGYANDFS